MKTFGEFLSAFFSPLKRSAPVVSPKATTDFFLPTWMYSGGDYTRMSLTDPLSQHAFVYSILTSISRTAASVPFQVMKSEGAEPEGERGSAQRRRERLYQRAEIARARTLPSYRKRATDTENAEPVYTGPLYELFRSPNPTLSAAQLWELSFLLYQYRGEVFWILESKSGAPLGKNEVPAEIWPIHPANVKFERDEETRLVKMWFVCVKDENGRETKIPYEPHQIVHFKMPNPNHDIRGLSPLDAAMSSLRQDFKSKIFNESFFDNGGRVGGVIQHEGELSAEQARSIKILWDDQNAGQGKSFKTHVLHSGAKWVPNTVTASDMQFLEQLKWNREELLAVWRVPKAVVGLYEDINYASSITAWKGFWQQTLIPMQNYFEDTVILRLFVPAVTDDFFGVFDLSKVEALRDDLTQKSDIATKLFALGFTRNQINSRLELGFDEDETGDVSYISSGLTPVMSLDDLSFLSDPVEEPTPPPDGSVTPNPDDDPAEEESGEGKPDPEAETKSRSEGDLRRRALWKSYVSRVLDPGEKLFYGKFRRYLFEMRKDTLKNLEAAAKLVGAKAAEDEGIKLTPDDIHRILPLRAKWDKALKESGQSAYARIMKLAWESTAEDLDSAEPFSLQNPRLLELMAKKLARLVQVNETIQKQLRSTLIEGMADGETVKDLADRIRGKFNQFSAARALTIARTETGIVSSGTQAALFQDEEVEKVEWLTAEDEIVRESHRAQDHEERDFGTPFPNGLRWPLEIGGPPEEVINCRCVLTAAS